MWIEIKSRASVNIWFIAPLPSRKENNSCWGQGERGKEEAVDRSYVLLSGICLSLLCLSCQHLYSKKYWGAAAEINQTHSFCLPSSSASSSLCKRKFKPSSCQVEWGDQHQVAMLLVLWLRVQLLGEKARPWPRHTLSLCRGLAMHSVIILCLPARVLRLKSQIYVLWGWMTIRNAWSKLTILQEEFYLASSSWRPFSEYSKSWGMGKNYGIAEGYISSIDHWLGI